MPRGGSLFRRLFAKPPFKLLAKHLAEDKDFLGDASRVLKLDEESFSRLAEALRQSEDFLDRESLTAIAREVLGPDVDAAGIAKTINNVAGLLHEADLPATQAMDELDKALEKSDALKAEDRKPLADRLRALATEPMGLAKQTKARELVGAIGLELDELRIICDVRPVFDNARQRIDGVVPIATLRLDYSRTDGDDAGVIEARVTEKQIEELGKRVSEAKQKLAAIKELAKAQGLPLPRTKSTTEEED
jgi:hypothetical protein